MLSQGKQFEQCQREEFIKKRNRARISIVNVNYLIQDIRDKSNILNIIILIIN